MAQTPVLAVLNAALLAALVFVAGCGFFPESSFTLSDASRLPRWIPLPGNVTREGIQVEFDFYLDGTGRWIRFVAKDKGGQTLARGKGTLRGSEPRSLSDQGSESVAMYEIVEVSGIVDVFEFRTMTPVVEMCDDPSVWYRLGLAY